MGLLNKFRDKRNQKDVVQEVISSISALLNSKQGFSAWQKGLGMQNYGNICSAEKNAELIIADLKYNIFQYEKRVQILDVKMVINQHTSYPKFQISCNISGKFHSFYIGFNKYLKPNSIEEYKDG